MKVTQVEYGMLRVTKQFENDRATVTVQLEEGDTPEAAIEYARKLCDEQLAAGRDAHLRDKLKKTMATEEGRADLERFLNRRCV